MTAVNPHFHCFNDLYIKIFPTMLRIRRSVYTAAVFLYSCRSCKWAALLGCTLFGIRDSHSFLHFLYLVAMLNWSDNGCKVRRPATMDVLMTTDVRCK